MLTKKMFVCMQQICQLKSFNKSIKHRMNKKCKAKRTEGESMQYKKIHIYDINIGLLAHGFPFPASWQLQKMCSVHLWVSMQALQKTKLLFFSSTTSKWESLPWIPTNCSSRTVATCGSADSDSVMANAWWCSTTFSSYIFGILEWVSGTMNGRRWTNSIECSFLVFKCLGFLYLETAKVYCLC